MTRTLTIISADQRLAERRDIVVRIFGKKGAGKTSQIADLANALPPILFMPLDLDDESSEPEVRS
jgi:uridine kinase